QELAGTNHEAEVVEDVDLLAAACEELVNVRNLNDRPTHTEVPFTYPLCSRLCRERGRARGRASRVAGRCPGPVRRCARAPTRWPCCDWPRASNGKPRRGRGAQEWPRCGPRISAGRRPG